MRNRKMRIGEVAMRSGNWKIGRWKSGNMKRKMR